MVKFKKCPRCGFEITDHERRFCPNCGLDLLDEARKLKDVLVEESPKASSEHRQDLERPIGGCGYIAIGIIGTLILTFIPFIIIYFAGSSGIFSDSGMTLIITLTGIFVLALYPTIWYFGAKGMYGKVDFFGFMNILVLSIIPIGGWVASYYFGKGLYMTATRQSFPARSSSRWGFILLSVFVCIAFIMGAFSSDSPSSPRLPASSPTISYATLYYIRETEYASTHPAPRSTPDPCLRWDQVSVYMKGRILCVKGIIQSLSRSRNTWTRYQFSSQPNTFFIYSVNREYYDPVHGFSKVA